MTDLLALVRECQNCVEFDNPESPGWRLRAKLCEEHLAVAIEEL